MNITLNKEYIKEFLPFLEYKLYVNIIYHFRNFYQLAEGENKKSVGLSISYKY